MTHFTVGIIVPEDKLPFIDNFVTDQMAPYDEGIRVAPYVCYSIEKAKSDIKRTIHRLQRAIERQDPEYDFEKCREILAKLRQTTPEEKYRKYVELHEKFNAQGEPLSAYNPNSKWDWYVIGGRWDGWINGKKTSREDIEDNIASTEQAIERSIIPHAIVTPDGQWNEHGQMGWFATLITENENWDAQAREILAGYPGQHFLILDAHI